MDKSRTNHNNWNQKSHIVYLKYTKKYIDRLNEIQRLYKMIKQLQKDEREINKIERRASFGSLGKTLTEVVSIYKVVVILQSFRIKLNPRSCIKNSVNDISVSL